MNNEMQVFSYEGNEVRTVQRGDEILWVLKDVCGILGIEKHAYLEDRLFHDHRHWGEIEIEVQSDLELLGQLL